MRRVFTRLRATIAATRCAWIKVWWVSSWAGRWFRSCHCPAFTKGNMADEPKSESENGEGDDQETALIPRSWFQGKDLEVGGKCKLRVEGIFDDEIEVSYVKSKKKDGKDKDSDDDDDDDKPKRRRRDRDDSDLMRESLSQMDMMAGPPPSMGGY